MSSTNEPRGHKQAPTSLILTPGSTCWRIERADRLTVIVDAADYFRAVREAMKRARHSILLIGWDFDTRVTLDHDVDDEAPGKLGQFLIWLARTRPALQIHVLKWDLGTIWALGRGSTPLVLLRWMIRRNIHFRLDAAHPKAAAHHQKIVVMDDVLAFCGGIDITGDRWDTRDHLDDDPHRVRPTTKRRYKPWHDATTAVGGNVARALGDLARSRWEIGTGESIASPRPSPSIWPPDLKPHFHNVNVGIARTQPAYGKQREVREVEALYLAAISAAERTVYIESQYFASRRVAERIAARLQEASAPEIVVVNPASAEGWLEEEVMGTARARLLKVIGDADRHGRFRIYTPVTDRGEPIYVHAKILIIDERLLRLGSSNLNNRSMGYDTECDLIVEVDPSAPDAAEVTATIRNLRNDLLGEHLGRAANQVADALARRGSLVEAIEELRGPGRSLRPFVPPEIDPIGDQLAESDLLDPESVG